MPAPPGCLPSPTTPGWRSTRWVASQAYIPRAGPGRTSAIPSASVSSSRAWRSTPERGRTARYRCAIAIAGPGEAGLRGIVEGTLEGAIASEPRGSGGFGYDPIFYVPELGRTVGELSAAQKRQISHRARAAAAARDLLLGLAQSMDSWPAGA